MAVFPVMAEFVIATDPRCPANTPPPIAPVLFAIVESTISAVIPLSFMIPPPVSDATLLETVESCRDRVLST